MKRCLAFLQLLGYKEGVKHMRDMHVHTEFSCDSDAKMEDYIEKAKTSGIGTICFTATMFWSTPKIERILLRNLQGF